MLTRNRLVFPPKGGAFTPVVLGKSVRLATTADTVLRIDAGANEVSAVPSA